MRLEDTSVSWLDWPTLTAELGRYFYLEDTSYFEDSLLDVVSQYGTLVMAGLERKVTGRFAGAVRVSVGGIEVGRVPSGEARRYLRKIWQFRDVGLPTTCRAVIAETEDHRFGRFLVQMFALPKPRVEDEPFLPPLKAVPVHQDGGLTGLIEQTLARHGGDQVITNTGELSLRNNAWRVSLDGESIGSLMPRAYVHLHEAEAAGCPLTCGIRINRSLRVTALIPPD